MAESNQIASASIGFEVDLRELQAQLRRAQGMIEGMQDDTERATGRKAGPEGLMGQLLHGAGGVSRSMGMMGGRTGMFGRLTAGASAAKTSFSGLGGAASAAGVSMGAVGLAIGGLLIGIGAAVLAVKGLQAAFKGLRTAMDLAVQQQATNISLRVLAQNSGYSSDAIQEFREQLERFHIVGAQANTTMQNLLQAQLPLNESTRDLIDVAQRFAVIQGGTTAEAVDTMTTAIANMQPRLLRQYGIITDLNTMYDRHAEKLGITAGELTEQEKRQAMLNTIIERGNQLKGAQEAAEEGVARGMNIVTDNVKEFMTAIGSVALPTFTGIMQLLIPISREMRDNSMNLAQAMEHLGQQIADRVVPAVARMIDWVRGIPWDRVIDRTYRVINMMNLLRRIVLFPFRLMWEGAKLGARGLGIVMSIIQSAGRSFQVLAQLASDAWKVISGQGSIEDLNNNLNRNIRLFNDQFSRQIEAAFEVGGEAAMLFADNVKGAMDDIVSSANRVRTGFSIDDFFAGLPKSAGDAWDAAGGLAQDETGKISAAQRKALQQLQEQLQRANEDFARQQARAARDFQRQLADLVAQHRDQIKSLQRDIAREVSEFSKAQAERAKSYEDELSRLNKADSDRKKDVERQLAEELAKGRFADQAKIASLRARLKHEDAQHKKAVEDLDRNYKKEVEAAEEKHEEKLKELQKSLDKELAIQRKHSSDFARFKDHQVEDDITRLKRSYNEQRKEDERAHKQRIADMVKQGREQANQAGANGRSAGQSYGAGMSSGIGSSAPQVSNRARNIGREAGNATASGISGQAGQVRNNFGNMLRQAAIGAAVGSIFGPIGAAIGGVIGANIGRQGGTIGGALRTMWNRGIGLMGNLWDYGRLIMQRLGQSLSRQIPNIVRGSFRTAWTRAGFPGFYKGGIVNGPGGRDNIPAMVTAGEMILNKSQQQRMFNMLDGKVTPSSGGSGSGSVIIETMNMTLPNVRNASDFERELKLKFASMRA